jgi:thioredoxin
MNAMRVGGIAMTCALKIVLGLAVGGGVGYGLSRLLCLGGGCPLTSNRPLMVLLGAGFGLWLAVAGCSRRSPAPAETAHFGTKIATEQEFAAQVVEPGQAALVDFYANWCGPCRRLAPVLAELEGEYAGRVKFFRIDIDEATELADRHAIRSIPTLLLYRGGRQVARVQPPLTADDLREHLDKLLSE